jgi:hypothetical protein
MLAVLCRSGPRTELTLAASMGHGAKASTWRAIEQIRAPVYIRSSIAKLNSKGAAAMWKPNRLSIDELIEVQSTADWRREKAKQFPDDTRNLTAAEELDTLATEISSLEDSEIHRQIADLTDRLYGGDNNSLDFIEGLNEAVSAELRSVGFHRSYTGLKFLEWYRDLLQETLYNRLDDAIAVPDLAEQVENDPAVKVAKQAYDEAYAKAYAEARKKL